MIQWLGRPDRRTDRSPHAHREPRLRADGGHADGSDDNEDPGGDSSGGLDRANVEVDEAGEGEPVDPKWEKPDIDEIPEFEVRAEQPVTRSGHEEATPKSGADPTAGMPNTARSPSDSRINRDGTSGYVAALELCARLPEDVRLSEQAADLVPAAVEAELEQDIQSFAAAEFDNPSPHVDVLEFVEREGDIWLRIRLGISPDAFEVIDPDEIRNHALQELEGLL